LQAHPGPPLGAHPTRDQAGEAAFAQATGEEGGSGWRIRRASVRAATAATLRPSGSASSCSPARSSAAARSSSASAERASSGGRGGDVVVVADPSLRDLRSFHRRVHFKAARGGHGGGGGRHGAAAEALEIPVPPGTTVEDAERDRRFELTTPGQRALVARGGP